MAATIVMESIAWSEGEKQIHDILKVPLNYENPTIPYLSPNYGPRLLTYPVLAVGTRDKLGRPWTTVWGGEAGFVQPLNQLFVGIRTPVDRKFDPVVEVMKDVKVGPDDGQLMSALGIDMMTRKRVKLIGRVAGTKVDGEEEEVQVLMKVEGSLAQCPKYIHNKAVSPSSIQPELLAKGTDLNDEGIALLDVADFFFLSSSYGDVDMDTNNRGGPPGFIRHISRNEIVYPEYSGNRLYQTLGNLIKYPAVGIVIPNFVTGDVLYITGNASILVGDKAAAVLPRSNLAVKVTIVDHRFVKNGLPLRGVPGEMSPYTPPLRVLATEGNIGGQFDVKPEGRVKLVKKDEITPTIVKYRFKAEQPVKYTPGQWVAMDFSRELNMGYSHMRDDDPKSLNDDFIRTFTVSSHPEDLQKDEFEIIARLNGPVTAYLKRQRITQHADDYDLKGFGGDFDVKLPESQDVIPFIAGGVGITPLLGHLKKLDLSKVKLVWIINIQDAKLVIEILEQYKGLAAGTTVFFTGNNKESELLKEIETAGAKVIIGRPSSADQLLNIAPDAHTWYLCASQILRNQLLEWLSSNDKTAVYESFDY